MGGEIAREGHVYRIAVSHLKGRGTVKLYFDFSKHPLRNLIRKFILDEVEGENAGYLRTKVRALIELGDFLSETGRDDINPEAFPVYYRWLAAATRQNGKGRLSELSVSQRLNVALMLYAFGLTAGRKGWNQRDLDTMKAFSTRIKRGLSKRNMQASIDKALSASTFNDLARAVTLEFEQCKQVLKARDAGERQSLYNLGSRTMKFLDPNPYVVFALQAAMRFGLRASELNHMTPDDVHEDLVNGNHEIYVHAPDKRDDFIVPAR